jgi:hypothetical protein
MGGGHPPGASEIGNLKLETGKWEFEIRKIEAGQAAPKGRNVRATRRRHFPGERPITKFDWPWKTEVGNSKLENRNWKLVMAAEFGMHRCAPA